MMNNNNNAPQNRSTTAKKNIPLYIDRYGWRIFRSLAKNDSKGFYVIFLLKNETLNISVANYSHKKLTYSTSIALVNKVVIAIDCYNLRFYIYLSQVFRDLSLCLNDDIKAFLIQKDRKCIYLKKYYSKIQTKKKRSESNNKKIQRPNGKNK